MDRAGLSRLVSSISRFLDPAQAVAAEVFASVAHLLNLDVDLVFVDTTSTYREIDVPDELADALRRSRTTSRCRSRTGPVRGGSGTPRTTDPTCRRW